MFDVLTPDQQAWLSTHVARGEFPSVEEAARQLIEESIAARADIERDDLAWARPYVMEALEAVDRGDVMNREQYQARLMDLPALKG